MLSDFSVVRYLVAIAFTALSYLVGILIIQRKFKVVQSVFIGATVVTVGYAAAVLNLPVILIFLLPFPFGILGLYLASDKNPRKTLFTYLVTWAAYIIFHIILSACFHFHSLIPPWKLSS
jgi:hypothetical protein